MTDVIQELRDKGRPSPLQQKDLTAAIDAVSAILHRTNDVLAREERQQAVRDLKAQVEDWKHHRVEAFGDLLLHGNHTVLKGDPAKDNEREVRTERVPVVPHRSTSQPTNIDKPLSSTECIFSRKYFSVVRR